MSESELLLCSISLLYFISTAVNTLQALHRWPCSVEKPPSASPPSRAKPVNASAALHVQHDVSVPVSEFLIFEV